MKVIFTGYTPTGKRVDIVLDGDRLYKVYTMTGRRVRLNEEIYPADFDFSVVKMALIADGYRF